MKGRLPWRDLALAGFVVAVCAAVLLASRGLPPGLLETMGPAAVPRGIAVVLLVLVALMLGNRLLAARAGGADAAPDVAAERRAPRRPWAAVALFAVAVAYAGVLQSRLTGFAVASTVFVVAAGLTMVPPSVRTLAVLAVLGAAMGFGGQYIFTQFFYVDLP